MGRALATTIGGVLTRDLRALRREIAAYPDEPEPLAARPRHQQ